MFEQVFSRCLTRIVGRGLALVALAGWLLPGVAAADLTESELVTSEAQSSIPSPAVAGTPSRSFLPPAGQLEHVVREAYARLEKLTAAAGDGVELTLTDFETLRRTTFDEVLWVDLATMPGGHVIDVVPESHLDQPTGVATVRYNASWRFQEAEWAATEEGRRMIGMTVAQVLPEVARELPAYQGVVALTRYRVRVKLDAREREYDAAVLWRPGTRPGDATFFVLDHIVQGVEEAARETRPVPAEVPLDLGPIRKAAGSAGTCESWTDTRYRSPSQTGTNGHFYGGHSSSATFSITCACDTACNSTCDARVAGYSCADTGGLVVDACHKMASALDASSDWRGFATSIGASCGAGLGCVQRACLFCACSLGVSVSAFGATVSFSSTNADWTGNLKFTATCAPCQQVDTCGSTEIIPSIEPGAEEDPCTSSSGGGGGGGNDGDDGGTGSTGGSGSGESCTDVYCNGSYAGEACGTTTEQLVEAAIEMCGGF